MRNSLKTRKYSYICFERVQSRVRLLTDSKFRVQSSECSKLEAHRFLICPPFEGDEEFRGISHRNDGGGDTRYSILEAGSDPSPSSVDGRDRDDRPG